MKNVNVGSEKRGIYNLGLWEKKIDIEQVCPLVNEPITYLQGYIKKKLLAPE